MSYVLDFWHAIVATMGAMDVISLGIMAAIIVIAGIIMDGFGALITTVIVSLVLFGVANYVRVIAVGHGANPGTAAADEWQMFLAMTMQRTLVYAVVFAAGISVVQVVRQIIASR